MREAWSLGDPLDRAPLAGGALEHHADLGSDALTHSCMATNSPCSSRISASYSFRLILGFPGSAEISEGSAAPCSLGTEALPAVSSDFFFVLLARF
jgi:hypothetical protein